MADFVDFVDVVGLYRVFADQNCVAFDSDADADFAAADKLGGWPEGVVENLCSRRPLVEMGV